MNEQDLKKAVDAVGQKAIDVGREVRKLPSPYCQVIMNHLKVENTGDVACVSSSISPYQKLIQTVVLEEFLVTEGYKICAMYQHDVEDRPGPFEYTNVEVSPGVYQKAVGSGQIYIAKEGIRLVVDIEERGYERYRIRVFSIRESRDQALEFLRKLDEYSKENNVLRGKKITPSFRHIKPGSYTWDSVILEDETRHELSRNIDLLLKNIDVYKANGLTFKRGLILQGPPGTGKTLIGKVLCNVLPETTIVWVTPGDLNESRKIRTTCELARELSPSVLFLEDVDLYGGHRERENKAVLGELMNQLDGVVENEFVIVIATTNRGDELEDALRNRPGRFDRVITIPKPSEGCRATMFAHYLKDTDVKGKDLTKFSKVLARKTDGYTGAHVRELVNSAIISAIEMGDVDSKGIVVLEEKHFRENIEQVRVKTIEARSVGFDSSPSQNPFDPDDWDD